MYIVGKNFFMNEIYVLCIIGMVIFLILSLFFFKENYEKYKILNKYDLIENQDLSSEESKKMMQTTEQMVVKIKNAFEDQLAKLYQSDIVDTDAEMKVFESMLNDESFGNEDHFNLKK